MALCSLGIGACPASIVVLSIERGNSQGAEPLDSTTNFVEHPELVARRIAHFASLVGLERMIAEPIVGLPHLRDLPQSIPLSPGRRGAFGLPAALVK